MSTGQPARALSVVVMMMLDGQAIALEAESLRLVPFPKVVTIEEGQFRLDRPLTLHVAAGASAAAVEDIVAELRRAGANLPTVQDAGARRTELRLVAAGMTAESADALTFRDDAEDEDYGLHVRPDSVVIRGRGDRGLLYGAATLCQLIRANRAGNTGSGIPCVTIRDWPSIRWRAFQDDLTRGPSSTLDELEREVILGAGFKLNLFTYYMEHQFAFRKHPVIGPPDGSLLPEELRSLVKFAATQGVDVLGNQQSFGHFTHILKHEEFEALRETDYLLTPANEDTYRLLDDMYSEVIPLLPFPFFNVCCDETAGLGKGPAKDLVAQLGEGGVYVRHIQRVYDLVKNKYGKRMMMWGDIILQHPDHLAGIPKDVIMLTWGYGPRDSFEDQIVPFARSGYAFFVCPGVNNWNQMLPDFEEATVNIRNFVRDGFKHRAMGVLNTAWDDDGETLNAPNWHGFAWGAECSWNAAQTPIEAFNRRIGAVLFGEKTDHFGRAVELLSRAFKLPGMRRLPSARFWELEFPQPLAAFKEAKGQAEALLGLARPALEHLYACRQEATINGEILDGFIFQAQRVELIGQRMLNDLAAAETYQAAYEQPGPEAMPRVVEAERLIRQDGQSHRTLAERYRQLWSRENRPYALEVPMKRYEAAIARYEAVANKLADARKRLAAGERLPSPAQVGLGPGEATPPPAQPKPAG
ncbi:MAG: family 20 glycosylhydrolase [Planctomycetes bacterium]|nr:family 20 glycosylhydrolase [Planctomycetota bacterium]